jgi:CheY-like chemotaxis protein
MTGNKIRSIVGRENFAFQHEKTSMPHTCLIAAHDPWFIQLIRVYSIECGLSATEAFVSQDILPAIHHDHPSVILLQIDLPGQVQGPELACSIRKDPLANSIPIILFYSLATTMSPELAEVASTSIQEPVSFGAFQEALEKAGIPNEGKVKLTSVGAGDNPGQSASQIKKYPKRKRKTAQ